MPDLSRTLSAILDAVDNALVATEHGRVLHANRAFARLFDVDATTLVNERLDVALKERGIGPTQLASLASGDLTITHRDQSTHRAKKRSAVPIVIDGRRIEITTFDAITSMAFDAEAIEQRDRLASAGMISAMAMHEMRSVLASTMLDVGVALEAMVQLPHDETTLGPLAEVHHVMLEIEQQTQRMHTLTTDFMDLVAPQESTTGFVDISATVTRVLRMLQSQSGSTTSLTAELGEVALVVASELRVQQILVNLVTNAFQALAERGGPGRVVVRTRERGGEVVLEVEDNGPGIAPNLSNRIFEPMFTTKRRGLGTGLGLFIVRRIADDLGARVRVESVVGTGTKFTVTFDHIVARSASGAVVLHPEREEGPESRILVVDADLSTLGQLRSEVPRSELTVARSLEEGERLLGRRQFDLVLVDGALAEEELPRALEAMTRTHGYQPAHFVVMLPQGSDERLRSWARGAGYAVTTKPLRAAPLVSQLLQPRAPR